MIMNNGLKELSNNLKVMTLLEELNLNGNHIGDGGIRSFYKNLKVLNNLKRLELGVNNIEKKGFEMIITCLPHLPQLEFLNMSCIYILLSL